MHRLASTPSSLFDHSIKMAECLPGFQWVSAGHESLQLHDVNASRRSIVWPKVHVELSLRLDKSARRVSAALYVSQSPYWRWLFYHAGSVIPSLPPGTSYDGPSADGSNECTCSSVYYSLLSACAICQERPTIRYNFYLFLMLFILSFASWSWEAYSENCSRVRISR